MAQKVHLVIIDPQNDFCDPKGSLYVGGADKDMTRLSAFVGKYGRALTDISITLDSHQDIDIAHPAFWRNSKGDNPGPFSVIAADDVRNGNWQPAVPAKAYRERALDYVEQLKANGRYDLMIWPEHCIIGSWGHNVYPELHKSLRTWCRDRWTTLHIVTKGSNPWTEHYSAIKAEVPDPADPSTQINTDFVQRLMDADEILITGEALSHCVANTFRDVAEAFGDDSYVKKLVLLEDTCSNVTGAVDCTPMGDKFVADMTARGMRRTTTKDYVA